jgi:hypothetical protein
MVKTFPVRSIIGAVAGAAAAWCEASFEPRRNTVEAVGARTGYSPPVVEYAFDRLFRFLTREAIERVIVSELGSLEVLDGFVVARDARSSVRALPIGRVCIISSRTTIGVAIIPAIFALCAKCEVLVKDRDDGLASAFFATLAQRHAGLSRFAVARAWSGASDSVDLGTFDTVVAFGSDDTLATIAATTPFPTRLIGYPATVTAGYIARGYLSSEAAAESIAHNAARDMLLYDGEGCLSLRILFVERGGAVSPARFATILRGAVDDTAVALPAMHCAPSAARRALAADIASFQTAVAEAIFTDAQRSFLLHLDAPRDASPLLLPRTLSITSVDAPADAVTYLKRHRIALEALAVAGAEPSFREVAVELGAARLAIFGSLQAPRLGTPHGGRPRIAEFVRWLVDES